MYVVMYLWECFGLANFENVEISVKNKKQGSVDNIVVHLWERFGLANFENVAISVRISHVNIPQTAWFQHANAARAHMRSRSILVQPHVKRTGIWKESGNESSSNSANHMEQ